MVRSELLRAVGETDPALMERDSRRRPHQHWRRAAALTACFCLVVFGALELLVQLGYFRAGCAGWPGTIVADGSYYYGVPHRGVYCYTPEGGSVRVLSTLLEDGWLVNDYGLYYKRGRSLYVRPHDTGDTRRLYTASRTEASHIGFSLLEDGRVDLTIYNKYAEQKQELLLDGKTGTVPETVMEPTSYDNALYIPSYNRRCYTLGGHTLELIQDDNHSIADLVDKTGQSFLPETYPRRIGGNLLVCCYLPGAYTAYGEPLQILSLLLLPDGSRLKIPENLNILCGTDRFLLCSDARQQGLWCLDTADGTYWVPEMDAELDCYEAEMDAKCVYTCVPWSRGRTDCWKLLYDEAGRPTELELVESGI